MNWDDGLNDLVSDPKTIEPGTKPIDWQQVWNEVVKAVEEEWTEALIYQTGLTGGDMAVMVYRGLRQQHGCGDSNG